MIINAAYHCLPLCNLQLNPEQNDGRQSHISASASLHRPQVTGKCFPIASLDLVQSDYLFWCHVNRSNMTTWTNQKWPQQLWLSGSWILLQMHPQLLHICWQLEVETDFDYICVWRCICRINICTKAPVWSNNKDIMKNFLSIRYQQLKIKFTHSLHPVRGSLRSALKRAKLANAHVMISMTMTSNSRHGAMVHDIIRIYKTKL